MKKNVIIIFVMFILCPNIALAYSPDFPTAVHQYITNESKEVWPIIPLEIIGDYDTGDDIISGSAEEDRPILRYTQYLWRPDDPNRGNCYDVET